MTSCAKSWESFIFMHFQVVNRAFYGRHAIFITQIWSPRHVGAPWPKGQSTEHLGLWPRCFCSLTFGLGCPHPCLVSHICSLNLACDPLSPFRHCRGVEIDYENIIPDHVKYHPMYSHLWIKGESFANRFTLRCSTQGPVRLNTP